MWRTIIFFNPLQTHFPTDFASDKMNKAWTGLEQAPQGTLKNKLYGLGLKLLVRVKPSEIFFKSITKEVSEVEIVYPTSLNARLVLRRLRHIASRGCVIHKKYLYASASLVPLTTAFTVLRLPNIPFFRSQVLISYEEAHDNIIGESSRLETRASAQSALRVFEGRTATLSVTKCTLEAKESALEEVALTAVSSVGTIAAVRDVLENLEMEVGIVGKLVSSCNLSPKICWVLIPPGGGTAGVRAEKGRIKPVTIIEGEVVIWWGGGGIRSGSGNGGYR
ncbi:unnamed protein product [Rhodiola kirilowii]